MNKTLATQLSEKLGVDKPQLSPPLERRPGIKNRIERSGKLPKLSKGNVVPWTQTTREPATQNNSWNGGDYWEAIKYLDRFWLSLSSCELTDHNDLSMVGYLWGVPVVVVLPNYSTFPVSISLRNGERLEVTKSYWLFISQQNSWEEIGCSFWGAGFQNLN